MMKEDLVNRIQSFHGHLCPGLAMGIQASQIALEKIGSHSADEEVVAVVETDMCAVDAVQFLTGCTFGKGNLVFRDYGKNAFTFIRRSDEKAIRIMTKPQSWGDPNDEHRQLFAKVRKGKADAQEKARFQELHIGKAMRILDASPENLFDVTELTMKPPKIARIHTTIQCEECNETAMETRIRIFRERKLCIPCFEKFEIR